MRTPVRKSDPLRCNKCGYPLTAHGMCDQDCAPIPTPAAALIGRSHTGRLAAPVGIPSWLLPPEQWDDAA
jgi:hypothetical protein